DGAAEAFDQAYEFGHDAQPGLAKLQFANGQIDEAQRSIARALAVATGDGGFTDRAARGRLLPTQVEIALARGDLDVARAAVEELEVIAADFDRPLHTAGALTARGELLLGEQRPVEASPILGKSWRLWQTTDLPYEAAQARLRYAEALTAEGDADGAKRDLLAARKVFDSLGATRDLRRVDAILEADGPRGTGTRSDRDEDVHVHGHRHVDGSRRADRRRGVGGDAELARSRASEGFREGQGRRSQPHGRRVLRGIRSRARWHRLCSRHPAPPRPPPSRARVRPVGAHRAAFGRGDAARERLLRARCAHRGARRGGGRTRGDPRHGVGHHRIERVDVRPLRAA